LAGLVFELFASSRSRELMGITQTLAISVAIIGATAAQQNATDVCSDAGCSFGCLAATGVCYKDL
jgi:hypothetical protein